MPDIELPNPKIRRWSGPYLGNYYGELWRTFNIDLENSPGHISLAKNFISVADTSDTNLKGLSTIDNFIRTDADCIDRWWGLNRYGKLCKTDSNNPTLISATWDEDTLANSPTDARDMTIHENDSLNDSGRNRLLVTRDTAIASLNDTGDRAWNANWGGITLISGVSHPIEYFPLTRITLIGDGNYIHTVDKNKTVTSKRLTLPYYYQIDHIFTTTYRAWILCSGKQGKNGVIVEWDGYSGTYNNIYDAKSTFPLSGVNYNEIPIIVNHKGMLLEFNGNSFVPMIRNGQQIALPMHEEIANAFTVSLLGGAPTIPLARRGMTVSDDNLIYINVLSPSWPSQKQSGGIWCLNPNTGNLYLKYSLNLGSDTDYGQQFINGVGAIKAVNMPGDINNSSYLVAGGRIHSDWVAGTTENRIWNLPRNYDSTVRRGFFITQYIPADDIQEFWETLWVKFSAFKNTNDKIIVKAKGVNSIFDSGRRPLEGTCTWTSTTTFTVTLNASDDALAVGDEIEVLNGKNSGTLAHIIAITGNHAALQTIEIDETVTNGSGGSKIRFDRWKKLGVIDNSTKYFVPLSIGISSSFIQFKVELRGQATDFNIKSLNVHLKKQTDKQK